MRASELASWGVDREADELRIIAWRREKEELGWRFEDPEGRWAALLRRRRERKARADDWIERRKSLLWAIENMGRD